MGGLVVRCYLQNPDIPDIDGLTGDKKKESHKGVDKVFTYGTPHRGISLRRGLGWIEGMRDFIDPNNAGNFGPARMREFLSLPSDAPLHSLNGWFPPERIFCLIGTDAHDYRAAAGLSKHALGPFSDGLVQIENASVLDAPRAFVHRSHSGYYGLVNSESGYQNLRRFLFGEWRVLVEMTDVVVTLPTKVERKRRDGFKVRASYHIDTVCSVRGVPVELNRRTFDEESAIFRKYDELTEGPTKLFTVFMMGGARVNLRRKSLGFALRLQVRVPEYEIDRHLWIDDHYEGGTLFSDKLNIELIPGDGNDIRMKYGWDSRKPNQSPSRLPLETNVERECRVGLVSFKSRNVNPGIKGKIRLTISPWNNKPE